MSAHGLRFVGLCWIAGKGRYLTTPLVKKLKRHVTQPADSHYPHTVRRSDAEFHYRIEYRDAAAKQRTRVRADRSVDLDGYDGLELRVRGSGRTFEVEVDDDTRRGWRSVSRRAPFQTTTEWALVRVPFTALRTTVFGQPVNAPPIDLANVKRIGLYILDGIDGPFSLEVDEIRAYRADDH